MKPFIVFTFILLIKSGHPLQSTTDPFDSFGNFDNAFDKLDEQDKFNEALDRGFVRWEEACVKNSGVEARDAWLKAQENLIFCFMENFDVMKIQDDINEKKLTGDLDLVFKQYCGKPVRKFLPCVEKFLEASRNCVQMSDRSGVNVTMNMIDSAIEFMCYNSGDRMALFMAEDGLDCVQSHSNDILHCLNSTEFFDGDFEKTNWILFDQRHCSTFDALRRCVESELLRCQDPTPSNIINSMILAMRNATPCRTINTRASAMESSSSSEQIIPELSLVMSILSSHFVLSRYL